MKLKRDGIINTHPFSHQKLINHPKTRNLSETKINYFGGQCHNPIFDQFFFFIIILFIEKDKKIDEKIIMMMRKQVK